MNRIVNDEPESFSQAMFEKQPNQNMLIIEIKTFEAGIELMASLRNDIGN